MMQPSDRILEQFQTTLTRSQQQACVKWVCHRIKDYKIQLDVDGDLGFDGVRMSRIHIVMMLKRDYRNAHEAGTKETPHLANRLLDHLIDASLDRLIQRGMRKMEDLPDGHYES